MIYNTIVFPGSKFPYWNNLYGIIVYTFIYIIAHINTYSHKITHTNTYSHKITHTNTHSHKITHTNSNHKCVTYYILFINIFNKYRR